MAKKKKDPMTSTRTIADIYASASSKKKKR